MSIVGPTENNLGSSQTNNPSEESLEKQFLSTSKNNITTMQKDLAEITQEVENIEWIEHIAIPEAYKEMESIAGGEIGYCKLEGDYVQILEDYLSEKNAASSIEQITGNQQIMQGISALNAALGLNSDSSLRDAITLLNTYTTQNGKTFDLGITIVNKLLAALTYVVNQKITREEAEKSSSHASSSQLEQDYLENMQSSLQEDSSLQSITSMEENAVNSLNASIRAEKYDLNNHSALWHIFHAIGFTPSQMKEREQETNNQQTIDAINTIGDGINSFLGTFQTDIAFSQVTSLLNNLIAKMKKILNDKKMPLTEKLNDVLSLLTEVLAIFNMIQQTTENQKMENEKKMAQASQTQAKNSIQNALLNEKILANAVADEKSAHIIQSVTTWLMLAVSAVTASPAFFFFMCIMTGLQQSGDLNKWTQELGDKMGAKWKADLVMAAVEMGGSGLFLAGETATKIAVEKMMTEVVEEITEAALANIDDATIHSATSELVENGISEYTDDNAEGTLVNISKKAASKAAKFVRDEFFALSPIAIIAKKMAGKGLVETTRTVIKSAIEHAIEEAVITAKGQAGKVISEEVETEIAATAAAKAVSEVSTTTVEEAKIAMTRTTKGFFENLKRFISSSAVKRTLFTYAYSLGTSNFVMNIATEEAKKKGEQLDTLETILAGVAQAILTIIGMIGAMGSSSLESGSEMSPLLKFQKIAGAAQALGQLSGARTDLEVANVLKLQAGATFNVKEQTSFQSILTALLKAMNQSEEESAKQSSSQQIIEIKSLNNFAMHIQDADNAAIKVLMEQSV